MRISDWSSDVCSSDLVPKENDHGSCKSIRRPHRHYRRAVRPRPPATAAVRCDRRPDRGIARGRPAARRAFRPVRLRCRGRHAAGTKGPHWWGPRGMSKGVEVDERVLMRSALDDATHDLAFGQPLPAYLRAALLKFQKTQVKQRTKIGRAHV